MTAVKVYILSLLSMFFSYNMEEVSGAIQNRNLEITSENDIVELFSEYLKNADVDCFSRFFSDKLELQILNLNLNCSKAQAYQVLKKFFNNYTPTDFELIYRSKSSSIEYFVGLLSCGGHKFEISLAVVQAREASKIQQIRITSK